MQIVTYVHRSGEGLPGHAAVTEISQATAEAVRPQVHAAIDALINDIKTGWTPPTMSAADQKAAADAAVKAAEQALADAKSAQADAQAAVEQDAKDQAEDAAAAPAAASSTAPSNGGARSGPLPDDFPGRSALRDAGINTYAQLRRYGDPTEIAGIGAATAAKIEAALA